MVETFTRIGYRTKNGEEFETHEEAHAAEIIEDLETIFGNLYVSESSSTNCQARGDAAKLVFEHRERIKQLFEDFECKVAIPNNS